MESQSKPNNPPQMEDTLPEPNGTMMDAHPAVRKALAENHATSWDDSDGWSDRDNWGDEGWSEHID